MYIEFVMIMGSSRRNIFINNNVVWMCMIKPGGLKLKITVL